jgi:hypothetical protein
VGCAAWDLAASRVAARHLGLLPHA